MSRPIPPIPDYTSFRDLERRNTEAGNFWFEPDTMRFFRTRLCGDPLVSGSRVFFVTSERNGWDNPRLYSVRVMDWGTGDVDTVGQFQGYRTRSGALGACRRAAQEVAP